MAPYEPLISVNLLELVDKYSDRCINYDVSNATKNVTLPCEVNTYVYIHGSAISITGSSTAAVYFNDILFVGGTLTVGIDAYITLKSSTILTVYSRAAACGNSGIAIVF